MKLFDKVSFLSLAILLFASCGGNKSERKANAAEPQKVNIPINDTLKTSLDEFAHKPRCQGKFGLYVYDLTADKPVYGMNENQAMSSASCMKLLTGVAGLHLLGTDFKYNTAIFTKGNIEDGTLKGDATFRAKLDPMLNEPDLKMFAEALRRKGVKRIDGKMIVNLVLHEPVKSEQHWYPWDLSFSSYGILYKGADRVTKALKYALRNQGIAVKDSQVVLGKIPQGSHCVFRYYRPVDRVINKMWKNSSNTQATSFLYTIGNKVNPRGSFTESGVKYLRKFMQQELGLKDSSLVVHDGCGLCTYNHLSPFSLVKILRYGYAHPNIYKVLDEQLSISGVDGTIRRFNIPNGNGRIHAKTGTLSHPYGISSLAGYCKTNDGHLVAFAIMDTEMSVLDAHVLQKQLCKILVK